MQQKMRKITAAASIAVMIICLVLVTGSTFSLFTDKSENDIAVNSATVDVKAEIGALTFSSLGEEQSGKFANGGTAKYENGTLTIVNMTPGDKLAFPITITNDSTVDIQYKITWTVTDAVDDDEFKLSDVLVASVDGDELSASSTNWTPWLETEANTKEVEVSVELPYNVSNDYQEQSANINFKVEAIQGNGTPSDIKTPDQLLIAAQNGGEVALKNDITLDEDDDIVIPEGKSLTIDLAGNSLTTADGKSITNNGNLYIVDNGKATSQVSTVSFMLASDETAGTIISATGAPAIINNGEMVLVNVNVTADIHKSVGHVIVNNGRMSISGGSVTSTADNGGAAIRNNGTLTVDGTTVNGAPQVGDKSANWPSYAIIHYGEMMTLTKVTINSNHGAIAAYGDVVLNDCNVELNGIGGSSHVFYVGTEGTEVVINSGLYNHNGNIDGSLGYIMNGAKVTINGGTFTATNGGYGFATYPGELVVNGGTFNNAFLDWGGPITICGGTFKTEPAAKYIPEHFESIKNDDGTYTVAPDANTTVIKTADDLLALSGKSVSSNNGVVEEKTIIFFEDIDLKGADFSSIVAQYNDKLNVIGNGHVISNANVVSAENDNSTEQAGMFYGYSGSTIAISDLAFKNITVTTTAASDSANYAAVVVGYAEAAITLNNVDITNCHVYGAKSSGIFAGHLSGSLTAKDCDVAESSVTILEGVEANGHYAGKYVGTLAGAATFTDCVVDVTLEGNLHQNNIGDIYGRSTSTGSIINYESYEVDNVTYRHETISDDVILYKVSEDYAESALTIPEGVTTIGGYAFAYNKNVETITLSSTVTTLSDRAFRDTAASAVILNEGLTEIPYQAFRNASNVTTVVIPSTVTTIGKEAFQNSGITELTIPANVTEIAYGGLRDMKALETVVIEGNVNIPVYAFRACTNLKTVKITGNDVTFGGTESNPNATGMIFTNTESGDGTAITVYVANEKIKERLVAADTAAKDYGGYTIVCEQTATEGGYYTDSEGNALVYDKTGLTGAIEAGEDKVVLVAGEYVMPSISGSNEVTIVGSEDTVIDVTLGAYMDSSKVSFEGVTFKVGTGKVNGNGSDYAALYTPNVTYTKCTFEGPFRVGRDGATFIDCTFNNLGNDYVWTYGNDVTFDGCTFNSEGKALLIYSDGGAEVAKVVVKKCIFNATQGRKAGAIANQNCAAVEIDNYGNGVNLTLEGNTVNNIDCFSGEWRIKSHNGTKLDVFVNGVEYTQIAIDGKLMTIDANKNVTVAE